MTVQTFYSVTKNVIISITKI